MIDWGREVGGVLEVAESREWLCTNGLGGFACGTVAGLLTRRYHGLLVAALAPPLGRTLMATALDETVTLDDRPWPLATHRWADGTVSPRGHVHLEAFRLDGTVPSWTYAVGDALVEKRVWMEDGANTTYVRYRALRAPRPLRLELKALVNYRDYHATTGAGGWRMEITPVRHGLRVVAFEGARPLLVLAAGAEARPAHTWYERFDLARERARGLDAVDDHLHAGTLGAALTPGRPLTVVLSAEPSPSVDGEAALARRGAHEAALLAAAPWAAEAPAWIRQLVLAADQFVVRRATALDPDGCTIIAGYPWFGDWGRDTMIALPGLALATGRPQVSRRILRTFAGHVDRGMLPNRFPDGGEVPEYNTVDATLWYFEAVRAHVEAAGDTDLARELYPLLAEIVAWHQKGTRHGIGVDPADGLLRAGEPGVQLTWMDARVEGREVTPRTGKAVEVNALWYNALRAMAVLARILRRPDGEWEAAAEGVAAGFARFWNPAAGCCFDVIDGPDGPDPALRPNQVLAVSLPASPLPPERQRAVVRACSRHLLTSFGLRSLAPDDPAYQGRYGGAPAARDGAYHQGTGWAWLLGPFALAHARAFGDRAAARAFLEPMRHHLADHGVGSIAEIFGGDPPFPADGCVAQAWSVGEILRAWRELSRPD